MQLLLISPYFLGLHMLNMHAGLVFKLDDEVDAPHTQHSQPGIGD